MHVDLNADMGESFGPWVMGDDETLLEIVTSANIACGAHAGDPVVMGRTMRAAVQKGVGIGAHPGFADLQGFGRRRMTLAHEEVHALVQYQVAAAIGMARGAGGQLRHVKLHGALSNMAAEDEELARHCFGAALELDADLLIVAQAATGMERAAQALGCSWAGEIFADRGYEADGRLRQRSQPGAMIEDAEEAAARVAAMLQEGAILCGDGSKIEARIDTVCLHGDTPGAIETAARIRFALETAGIDLRKL
ncbi:LamB/YcsF family protein [Profundibacterium mesophilum]|uniref:5-oxoprolinase subunit A n=1 Tax=Profundibacterium mesophilum KAUST100406-0324 TaxID=1037889 RepID=A0A921NVY7_9RHOB|nr:5-oxoprolinase subunit PxpA [Profundibacterium mesophilum]KAF0674558.1 LamB/YcsF family domain containing protein [Profundibacterium mesophilum KAUST100406-0324]